MRALVVYESMYGNTHTIADRIGDGLRTVFDVVEVVPVHDASAERLAAADLVAVGGPTHVHGIASARTRKAAVDAVSEDGDLVLDPDAPGDGLREWIAALGHHGTAAVAFDTRVDVAPLLSGRASKKIAKRLADHGFRLVAEPQSFLVDKDTHLVAGEAERATAWGAHVAALMAGRRVGAP